MPRALRPGEYDVRVERVSFLSSLVDIPVPGMEYGALWPYLFAVYIEPRLTSEGVEGALTIPSVLLSPRPTRRSRRESGLVYAERECAGPKCHDKFTPRRSDQRFATGHNSCRTLESYHRRRGQRV